MNLRRLAVTACLASLLSLPALAADHWVGTWATAPVALPNPEAKYGAAETTYREIVHISVGGDAARIILTNEFGLTSLTINAAYLAPRTQGSAIDTVNSRPVTFNGQTSITIPAGALAVSDPIALKLPALSDVAVSFVVPAQPIAQVTHHSFANQTSYTAAGSVSGAANLDSPTEIIDWPFLKGIDVRSSDDKAASIVAFGDSITDGAHSTRNTNQRWPDLLAKRLQADKKTKDLGVLNEGIGGNRVLHDNTGPSALARFDRDVLAQAGVKYLIILESINDIGHAQDPVRPYDVVSADDLITGLSQMATRAHTHGIKVYGATLTPYVGAKYSSPAGESIRQAVNNWIRTTNQLDGFIDFDKATQDKTNPAVFSSTADSGDHLHPADAGYKAMSDSIDLKLFTK
ncbi:SGNH/GDSL hydrolase family protein [Edaphobacter sp. 12200R-103]|jgi:lysophospholipase L1-like esterase|uniref:SGNH/GDSL hydrolase family protein n=1 Tax=Edaphobacter sp. 12200R-103 TaxID=2703788 RepID=UPI00138B71D5|nr:SGNH/GDSL hydrolase family protein [Edaphobacter sp. 12200R-103]QHS52209.1 SGNH/GDSL hydrolase family protein [Edaphobacter sp. 12200R-103]